jgi:hypothetical protein
MRKLHEHWKQEIRDPGPIPERELVASMWPNMVQPVTESPLISLENGKVTISCSTEGASIAYQVNGKGHNEEHSFLYTGPFEISEGDVVSAQAFRIGYKPSGVAQRTTE